MHESELHSDLLKSAHVGREVRGEEAEEDGSSSPK